MGEGRVFDPRDVVAAKRDGRPVPGDQLRAFMLGYARGEIPDYVTAAFLMAAYLQGLSVEETSDITRAMVDSGVTLPLSGVSRPKVDKHSTGGVSDGVTLVFAPLAAALGMAVAKLSGRGLGHTGGTLDKLESIPGLRTSLSPAELERQVEDIGCAVAGQSKDLVPADGALYALRDATATVASVPLIAASVMSKKLAVGTDLILLDVKAGTGAFMKSPQSAAELAEACMGLAGAWGRAARAAVTDMNQPLGSAIGNALDIAEAVRVLQGTEADRLSTLTVTFAAEALVALGLETDAGAATERAGKILASGAALDTFGRMVEAQGGDRRVVDDPWSVLPRAPEQMDVHADPPGGYVVGIDGERLGRVAVGLGAGRVTKSDPIDPSVGIEFLTGLGALVAPDGAPIGRVHARDAASAHRASREINAALSLSPNPPSPDSWPLVYGWHRSPT